MGDPHVARLTFPPIRAHLTPRPGRTRSGCQTCKQRHVRCDQRPSGCSGCRKRGLECPGYDPPPLKWMESWENKRKSYPSPSSSPTSENPFSDTALSTLPSPSMNSGLSTLILLHPNDAHDLSFNPTIGRSAAMANRSHHTNQSNFDCPLLPLSTTILFSTLEIDFLADHFFNTVSDIYSLSEGPCRTFNTIESALQRDNGLYHTVACISAIHLADTFGDQSMRDRGLRYRRKATVELSKKLSRRRWSEDGFTSCLLLSMTETYFIPDQCGKTFLEAAQQMLSFDPNAMSRLPSELQNAFCWLEFLTSLVVDHSASFPVTLDHSTFDIAVHPPIMVDPLVGTWVSILPCISHLAKVVRSTRTLTQDISSIETQLLTWNSDIEISDDLLSESTQFEILGHAYRASGLILLYSYFPDLLNRRVKLISEDPRSFLHQLSQSTIQFLRKIPIQSKKFNGASFPLLTAGSFCQSQDDRTWILALIEELRCRNGIEAVVSLRCALEEVWRRRDQGNNVTWLDVFADWNWEPLIN